MTYTDTFHPDTVILGGGDYPVHPVPLQLLREAERVICLDGAAVVYMAHEGKTPWRIVGDGDSLPPSFCQRYAGILRRIPEQESNDQTKATRYAQGYGAKRVAYVGATGRREDHALGNISLLMDYMRMGLEVRMYTDYGVFVPCRNRFESPAQPEVQVSIFNFGARNFSPRGLRYPFTKLDAWWEGTLNAVLGNSFSVEAEGDFLVFMTYDPK